MIAPAQNNGMGGIGTFTIGHVAIIAWQARESCGDGNERSTHRQWPEKRKGALLVQSAFVVPLDGFEPSSQP